MAGCTKAEAVPSAHLMLPLPLPLPSVSPCTLSAPSETSAACHVRSRHSLLRSCSFEAEGQEVHDAISHGTVLPSCKHHLPSNPYSHALAPTYVYIVLYTCHASYTQVGWSWGPNCSMGSKNLAPTLYKASMGHGWNQSMTVPWWLTLRTPPVHPFLKRAKKKHNGSEPPATWCGV